MKVVKKLFTVFLLVIVFVFFSSAGVFSKEEEKPVVSDVNSFELFWPISAGKTKGDSLYLLKNLKEKMRGLLIFGKLQKADYSLFLATKRVVEVEKLLNKGEKDYASKTLDMAKFQLDLANKYIDSISVESSNSGVIELTNKLSNLGKFLPFLSEKNKDSAVKIQELLDKVLQIHSKI